MLPSRLCNQLAIKLRYDEPADILAYGVEKYINILQEEVCALDLAIQEGFFVPK
jgi:hypothetical protein